MPPYERRQYLRMLSRHKIGTDRTNFQAIKHKGDLRILSIYRTATKAEHWRRRHHLHEAVDVADADDDEMKRKKKKTAMQMKMNRRRRRKSQST